MDLSIVLPVYNEAGNLEQLYQQLTAALEPLGHDYEIVAVDDGSTDGSAEVLRRLHVADPRVKVIRLRRNFGQTAAFSAGFDHARGRVIITLDADLQNDPADIPILLAKLNEGYDIVSGWRVERKEPFFLRRLPSIVANWLISGVIGVKLHDYGCSLKVYRREVIENIHLYGELHRFIPAMASWMGVRVAEVPVRHAPRRYGKSKYNIARTVRVILDLLTVRFLLSYSARPMQIFGLMGLVSFGLGVVICFELSVEKFFLHHPLGNRPLLWLGVLLIVVGVQLVSMGLLGELVMRTYHETQGKPIYAIREILE